MPAINGTQLKERIRNLKSNIWFDGQKIPGDITAHPAFRGVIRSKASLYDFQLQEEKLDLMTYRSPSTGDRVGRSFQPPVKKEDLELRRLAAQEWAKLTGGMIGRTPDYMNTALMALSASADVFEGKNKLGRNVTDIYEKARENDLTFSHTYVTPQVNRSLEYFEDKEQPISARVVKVSSDGIYIKVARLLATQGGITDELMVLPAGGKFIEEDYVYAFSVSSSSENLKFVCRESFVYNESHFDHPLGSELFNPNDLFNFPATGLRFFTVYGPWGRPDMAYYSFTKDIIEGKKIKVFNHGDMKRDFTYIDDIVEGIVRLLKRPPSSNPDWDREHPEPGSSYAPYKIYNIGNNHPVNLIDFIQTLEKLINKKAIIEFLPMQPGDVKETYADISDLQQEICFSPATALEAGLGRFVEWYKNYHSIDKV